MIANTPPPPYYVVIFSSLRTDVTEGYDETANRMLELAAQQPGYLGVETGHGELGLTLSYWADLDSIKQWKGQVEHLEAQRKGRSDWYAHFKTRIAKVERDYDFIK